MRRILLFAFCLNDPNKPQSYTHSIDIANIDKSTLPVWNVLKWVRGIWLDLHRSETLREGKFIKSQNYQMIPILEGLL